jgi:hypothetical protein
MTRLRIPVHLVLPLIVPDDSILSNMYTNYVAPEQLTGGLKIQNRNPRLTRALERQKGPDLLTVAQNESQNESALMSITNYFVPECCSSYCHYSAELPDLLPPRSSNSGWLLIATSKLYHFAQVGVMLGCWPG